MTVRHAGVRSSRVVLAPLGWRQVSQVLQRRSRSDGDNNVDGSPGRARSSRINHCAGKAGVILPVPVVFALSHFFCARARGCSCRHPVFPAPSSLREREERCKTRAKAAARRLWRVYMLSLRGAKRRSNLEACTRLWIASLALAMTASEYSDVVPTKRASSERRAGTHKHKALLRGRTSSTDVCGKLPRYGSWPSPGRQLVAPAHDRATISAVEEPAD
jgi:hypothetical protein